MSVVAVSLYANIPEGHLIWIDPSKLDATNPSLGRTDSDTVVSNQAKIVVSRFSIVAKLSGTNLTHEIPSGTLIIVREGSKDKIAETAQPLQVTSPGYPFDSDVQ